jgi:(p)ppGpp synthase/HD superfamily hydrolase
MNDIGLFLKAQDFGRFAHSFLALTEAKKTRKYTGEPYYVHTEAVAQILLDHGAPDEVVAAALLHDVIEDTIVTEAVLLREFGITVTSLVMEVTEVSRPRDGNRAKRKRMDRDHYAAGSYWGQSIKLADLIDNTKSITAADPDFSVVYMQEKAALLKVLTKGDRNLHVEAQKQVSDYYLNTTGMMVEW